MTKEEAVYSFFSQFGDAYDENYVPTGEDAPEFPYITYTVPIDRINFPTAGRASLWYRSTSWTEADAKAVEIAHALPKVIPFAGGGVLLTGGAPFSQRMNDPGDNMIRRIYINITAEFLSAD